MTTSPPTIPFGELRARFGPHQPFLPTFLVRVSGQLELYYPAWTPVQRLASEYARHCAGWSGYDVGLTLVADVPREVLFGDWREACPDAELQP